MKPVILLFWTTGLVCGAGPAERTLSGEAPVRTIAFAPDGKTLVASYTDQHVRTWDLVTGKVVGDQPNGGFLLSSKILVEPSPDRQSLHVWDLAAARQRYTIDKRVAHATASPDAQQLAISSERSIQLVDAATGALRKTLPDGIGGAATLLFSPDGGSVVSANYDNDVRVWSSRSGELLRKMEDFTGAMFAAAFTPDGRQLVMGGLDETVYIFDTRTYSLQRKLTGHGETILALAISPDGRTLVTGGFDVLTTKNPSKLVFWDLPAGVIQRTVRAPHAVTALEFAPDGKWVAMAVAGGKEISLIPLAPATN